MLAHLTQLEAYLQLIRDFDAEQQQAPAQARDEIEQQIASQRNWFVEYVKPQLRAGALEWAALSGAATEATEQAEIASTEAQRILNELRTRAGETVAEQLSDYYRHQAKGYSDEATGNIPCNTRRARSCCTRGSARVLGLAAQRARYLWAVRRDSHEGQRDLITAEVRRVFENPDTGWISHGGNETIIEAPTILSALRPPVA